MLIDLSETHCSGGWGGDETRHKGSLRRAHLWTKLMSLHLIQKLVGGSQGFSTEDDQFASEDGHPGEGV